MLLFSNLVRHSGSYLQSCQAAFPLCRGFSCSWLVPVLCLKGRETYFYCCCHEAVKVDVADCWMVNPLLNEVSNVRDCGVELVVVIFAIRAVGAVEVFES